MGSPPQLNLDDEHTPAEIWKAIGSDVLGRRGWTIDEHLSGKVGVNWVVKQGLQKNPLRQADGWDSLCPTKTKATGDRFKSRKVETGRSKSSSLSRFFNAKWMERKEYITVT